MKKTIFSAIAFAILFFFTVQSKAQIKFPAKVILAGPYVSTDGIMQDSLRSQHLIPATEPYTNLNYFPIGCPGYVGGETVTPAMLSVTGNDAIVDWVHIEIRTAGPAYLKIATKNALVQRDGDIIDANGGPLTFDCVPPGNYYVTVKHRNHLGAMTGLAQSLDLSGTALVDFTTDSLYRKPSANCDPVNIINGKQVLWAGNTNLDHIIKYNSPLVQTSITKKADKDQILYAVGVGTSNNTAYGYRSEDVNMDGKVRYNIPDSDKNFILYYTLGVYTPNRILEENTPN